MSGTGKEEGKGDLRLLPTVSSYSVSERGDSGVHYEDVEPVLVLERVSEGTDRRELAQIEESKLYSVETRVCFDSYPCKRALA